MPINIGLVGCGRHGSRYAELLNQYELGARLIAASRRSLDDLKRFAEKFNIKNFYTDYRELLSNPEVEAVIIATPNNLHAEVAVAAAEAGKHILIEKPMAVDSRQAMLILEAASRYRVKLMVSHNFRFHPVFSKVKELIPSIGRPYLVSYCKRQEAIGGWRESRGMAGGGVVMDLGVHLFDMCLWLTGFKASSIYCYLGYLRSLPVEDWFIGVLEADGAKAILDASMCSRGRVERLEASGDRGQLVADRYDSKITLVDEAGRRVINVLEPDRSLLKVLESFINSIRYDAEPQVTGEEGLEAVKICEACYESARVGRPISL